MIKSFLYAILTIQVLILAGCSTPVPVVQHSQDPGIDFTEYESFALLPLPETIPGARPGALLEYGRTAQGGMREALLGKGYTEAPIKSADVALGLKGSVVPTIMVREHGFNYGYNNQSSFWGSNYPQMTFGVNPDVQHDANDQVTLALEVFDVESREMVWVGWIIGMRTTETVTHELVKERIQQILEDFPER